MPRVQQKKRLKDRVVDTGCKVVFWSSVCVGLYTHLMLSVYRQYKRNKERDS